MDCVLLVYVIYLCEVDWGRGSGENKMYVLSISCKRLGLMIRIKCGGGANVPCVCVCVGVEEGGWVFFA